MLLIWYAGRDSNPQPSEPESDALSIEPPARTRGSAIIIAETGLFVKVFFAGPRKKMGQGEGNLRRATGEHGSIPVPSRRYPEGQALVAVKA